MRLRSPAAARELLRALGEAGSERATVGRETMRLARDEVLDALGLGAASDEAEWITPALIGFGVGALVGAAFVVALGRRRGSMWSRSTPGHAAAPETRH